MESFHHILSIAKYERKTLLRSWFFRIFSILSLGLLFLINFGMIIQGGGDSGWAIRSIPSAIPYVNLLLLNVAQAIISVFLASDFLKRDKKLDTTEVIYMRSMTNGAYVIGKTWGNLQVFLVLNLAVVVMALVFNMLAQGTSIHWFSYAFYLVLISVPTLIFIMGLSFLLMSVLRNQAITFVIILGYIGITLFFLQDKFYYIFDYMAFNIPMLMSDMVGVGNLEQLLVHRGIYFSLGLSFIFFTIFLLKRLPQSETMTIFSLVFAILLLSCGSYLGYSHISKFIHIETVREDAIALNNTWVNERLPVTLRQHLSIEHEGSRIQGRSVQTVMNTYEESLHSLIISLNRGLEVKSVKVNGRDVAFSREHHLILMADAVDLPPGAESTVEIEYAGGIDEHLAYLDVSKEERIKKHGKFVLNVDKRYAFLTPDYLLLTPEVNWYPKTGVTYSSDNVRWSNGSFIDFSLEVKTPPDLKAISQGECTEVSPGFFRFQPETALPQISLAVGRYEKKMMTVDSLELGIWHMKGHDFFTGSFPALMDTMDHFINDRLGDFERSYRLNYPFNRLYLVEVPAQFKSFRRVWTSAQETVQPEQVLIAEKGYLLNEADFEGAKKRLERWGSRDGASLTEKEKESRSFMEFLALFTREQGSNFRGSRGSMAVEEVQNPFFLFPMLYNFQNTIQSDQWPIVNRVFEAYLKGQSVNMRQGWMRDMQGMSTDELANIALQDSTFEQILADPDQKKIIDNVIKLKGEVLFSMVQWKAESGNFEQFLRDLLVEYQFKNLSFDLFVERIKETFEVDLIPLLNDWYTTKKLPGYLFSPIEAVKVKQGNRMLSMVSLKLTNFSDVEGIIRFSFRLGGGGGPGRGMGMRGSGAGETINKLVYLAPNQTKDVSFLLDAEPRMVIINTMTSRNIPQVLTTGFREVPEDPRGIPYEGEAISDIPVARQLPGEIIIDNEDPGFSITVTEEHSLLEKWFSKGTEGTRKYSGISYWRPPFNWTATTHTDFYGQYIRSGAYIKSGDGSMKASWHVPVAEPGYYDVYYHLYKARSFGRRGGNEEQGDYQFFIHGDDGVEEQLLSIQSTEAGWNHLGSFHFSPDTALIELTNKTQARIVFADAVRLVRL